MANNVLRIGQKCRGKQQSWVDWRGCGHGVKKVAVPIPCPNNFFAEFVSFSRLRNRHVPPPDAKINH